MPRRLQALHLMETSGVVNWNSANMHYTLTVISTIFSFSTLISLTHETTRYRKTQDGETFQKPASEKS